MEITLDIINKLDKNDKDYLARHNIEIFTDYMLDAWHHEGWGNETMIRDIEELLEDVEMGETIKQFLEDVLDRSKKN